MTHLPISLWASAIPSFFILPFSIHHWRAIPSEALNTLEMISFIKLYNFEPRSSELNFRS